MINFSAVQKLSSQIRSEKIIVWRIRILIATLVAIRKKRGTESQEDEPRFCLVSFPKKTPKQGFIVQGILNLPNDQKR